MKRTKLELVRYLLAENIKQFNKLILPDGDKNVNDTRKIPKRYKQYF